MYLFQTPTAYSDSIHLPACPWCGGQMMLARIDANAPDHKQRTFECFRCRRSESVVVKSKQAEAD